MGKRRGGGYYGCQAKERRVVGAASRERIDESGDLHGVGGGEVDDMEDGEGDSGVDDGGVGDGEAKTMPRSEVDEGGKGNGRERGEREWVKIGRVGANKKSIEEG